MIEYSVYFDHIPLIEPSLMIHPCPQSGPYYMQYNFYWFNNEMNAM